MKLYILEEAGRILTDKSILNIVRELILMGEINLHIQIVTVSGLSAEEELHSITLSEFGEDRIVFIVNARPYLMGEDQIFKFFSIIKENDNALCRDIIYNILKTEGII